MNKPRLSESDILAFYESPVLFAKSGVVSIMDAKTQAWVTYEPWPIQLELIQAIHEGGKVACLKSRQLGVTWTCLVYILWRMVFDPIATVGIFSIGGREARDALLRLIGMQKRLPYQIQLKVAKKDTQKGIFQLYHPDPDMGRDGSIAYSLPSTGGEGLTLNTVLADEAGRAPGYSTLMGNVMPAIDDSVAYGTGKVMAVGIFDKQNPNETYRAQILDGLANKNGWKTLFFPWYSRPDRTREWFEAKKEEMEAQHGSDDKRKQQYPETIDEALSPPESDRRISDKVIKKIRGESEEIEVDWGIPSLRVFEEPEMGRVYCVSADPAGGLSDSDDSVTMVFKREYGEVVFRWKGEVSPESLARKALEVSQDYGKAKVYFHHSSEDDTRYRFVYEFNRSKADGQALAKRVDKNLLSLQDINQEHFVEKCEYTVIVQRNAVFVVREKLGKLVAILQGKFEPGIHALYSHGLCRKYNNAKILPERNNHGYAFIMTLTDQETLIKVIDGLDKRPGWYNSKQKKNLAYDQFIQHANARMVEIGDEETLSQLGYIRGSTLDADNDDLAIGAVLGVQALLLAKDTVTGKTI